MSFRTSTTIRVKILTKRRFLAKLKNYLKEENLTELINSYDDVVLEEVQQGYLRIGVDGKNKYITSREIETRIPRYVSDVPLTDLIFFLTLKHIRTVSNGLINNQMAFNKCENQYRKFMNHKIMKKLKRNFIINQCQVLVSLVLNEPFLTSVYTKINEKFTKKINKIPAARKARRIANGETIGIDSQKLHKKIEKYAIKITKGIVKMWQRDAYGDIVIGVHRDYKDLFVTYNGNGHSGYYSDSSSEE